MEKWLKGDEETNMSSLKKCKRKDEVLPIQNKRKRKYNSEYTKFGFILLCVNNKQ